MSAMKHPILKGYYSRREDGLVEVTAPDGKSGVFDRNGNWIEGELAVADPALCYWIAQVTSAARPSGLG